MSYHFQTNILTFTSIGTQNIFKKMLLIIEGVENCALCWKTKCNYVRNKTNTRLDFHRFMHLLGITFRPSNQIIHINRSQVNFDENFHCTMSIVKLSNSRQIESCYKAYSLQLNIIKQQTKYQIISFHKHKDNLNKKFHCTMSDIQLKLLVKQKVVSRQIWKMLIQYNSTL